VLVRRSRDRLEREIERFFVAEIDGVLVGCCALYPYDSSRTAELACLAVHPGYRQQAESGGLGTTLVKRMETEARRLGLTSLFVLTTQTGAWFQEQGFHEAQVDDLPTPKKALYNYQRNSKVLTKEL
jgi:amino-acid N-acetyltransferase